MKSMNDIEPDTISYNYAINTWINSNNKIPWHFMNETNVLKLIELSYQNKQDEKLIHGKLYN